MAAMVAYNLMLSLFPFALLLLFIAGQLLQSGNIQETILLDLQELFPSTEQDTLESSLDRIRDSSTEIGIVAIVAGLWIGASFWGAMDTAFCRIYHVECRGWLEQKRFVADHARASSPSSSPPASPSRRSRASSSPASRTFRSGSTGSTGSSTLSFIAAGLVISFLILCLIYWAVPKGHLPWRGVWPGALFMTVAAGIANAVFPLYLANVSGISELRPDRLVRDRPPALVLRPLARAARRRRDQRAPLRAPRHGHPARDDRATSRRRPSEIERTTAHRAESSCLRQTNFGYGSGNYRLLRSQRDQIEAVRAFNRDYTRPPG